MTVKFIVVAAVAVVAAGHPPSSRAQSDSMQQTASCVLAATKDTRSTLAVQLIRTACNQLAIHTGAIYARERSYNQCLIQNLSGAQSNAAASQIQSACRTLNPL